MSEHQAYPLEWPAGWQRTQPERRRQSVYRQSSFARNRDEVIRELGLMGASYVTLSTNVPLRLDGLPYANTREPDDPGVAVYWVRSGEAQAIACDRWWRCWENMRACLYAIQSLRQLERCGASEILNRAFAGFRALPQEAGTEHWRVTLGIALDASVTREAVEAAYREQSRIHHPDRGGSHERQVRINAARAAALAEVSA